MMLLQHRKINMFNIVEITKNEFNTFFISINGEIVADSSTIKRVRGFWNSKTKQYTDGTTFTKKNISKDPYIVLPLLTATGIDTTSGSWAVVTKI
jgi:hypothetical protein